MLWVDGYLCDGTWLLKQNLTTHPEFFMNIASGLHRDWSDLAEI
jgi:hypothetical protein